MDIQINSYPVDFELENEKDLNDVIASISTWANTRDLIFVEAEIDDEKYRLDHLPDLPLDDIHVLNCIIHSKADVVVSSLEEGIRYCDKAIKFCTEESVNGTADDGQLDALTGGTEWIIDMMASVYSLLNIAADQISTQNRTLEEILKDLNDFRNELVARSGTAVDALMTKGAGLFSEIRDIFRITMMSDNLKMLVMESIDSPDLLIDSIVDIKEKLPEIIKSVTDAAVSYQSGKDQDGSEKLQQFINFIFDYSRTIYQLVPVFQIELSKIIVDGVSLEEKNGAIKDLLKGMMVSLENNDIISLSDIMEYELHPALENLETYVEAIIAKIKS